MFRVLIILLTLFVTTPYAMSMQGEMASNSAAQRLALAEQNVSAMEHMISDKSSCCCCETETVMATSMTACLTTLGLLDQTNAVSPLYRSSSMFVPVLLPVTSAQISGIDRPPIHSVA
ncbi:hypothetical protein [Pseudovibrio sp. Ad26]|uniref:hypothetical protein n=1 Tax=Pseudovibrio sp. Ad26 TaxID=989410 RepID=UPI0007AEC5AC|nr:hypothetical protein [Pseudovibrio sp. Ad26]KZL13315.1 hypothetical protein PsAD26_02085 [Pseudovibrio sp. Ad26]